MQDWEEVRKFGRIHRTRNVVKSVVDLWGRASKYYENKIGYAAGDLY